ncbi:MAG: pilus assembly protein PilM [bacterium]|nr:pilus assembly protein PilM [bacterium]
MLFSEKYLVIDYGSTHIKGALLQSGGPGGFKILRLESLPIVSLPQVAAVAAGEGAPDPGDAPDGGLDEYEYNLIRYVQSFFPEEQNFLLNLPVDRLFVRDVTVPTTNPKQMDEIIPFEVEGLLPVALEDAEVIGQAWETREEDSSVITFTARHESLEAVVRPLLRNDTSIRMLSVDAVGLAGLARMLPAEQWKGQSVGQIDVGGHYTIFNVVRDGKLVFSRQLPYGGQDITDIVAEKLGLSIEEAERKKLELELNLGYDSKRAAKPDVFFRRNRVDAKAYEAIIAACRRNFDELNEEIERSILALPCETPATFYVSGGAAQMGGVREFLEDALERRVIHYPLGLSSGQDMNLWATAIGTAEHYRAKAIDRLDFLDSPFGATLRGGSFNLGIFSTPILFVSASVIIFLISLLLSIWQDKQEISKYRRQVEQIAKQIPGLGTKRTVEEYVAAARRMCQERLLSTEGQGGARVLDILKTLSDLTPPASELNFRFSSFQYDEKSVQVIAQFAGANQAESLNSAAQLEEKYKTSPLFSNVEVLRRNILPDRRSVRMTFKLTLKRETAATSVRCR